MSMFRTYAGSSRAPRIAIGIAAVSLALTTACASSHKSTAAGAGESTAATGANTVKITTLGNVLKGPNGHTLYTNTFDTLTKIQCTGACATTWPPLDGTPSVSGSLVAADFATVARPDGGQQVTYQGHPVYYFSGDSAAGDTSGNGIADNGGTWHTASPDVVSTTGGVTQPPASSSSSTGGGYTY